MKYIFYFEL